VVDLYGRVGSLLEVGTGFHHELTGRENIYLNGAILGMRRAEIERKFDEIVAFSEIEKFIDTPIKHYSTGMDMRLAFSVAAHLEPEILLVDEVLTVGDVNFQKKCLGKIGEVVGQGRTVLIVSHQMNAIQELCENCIWLDQGKLMELGPARQVVARYLDSGISQGEWIADESSTSIRNQFFTPTRFCVVDTNLQLISSEIQANEKFGVLIEGQVNQVSSSLNVGFAVFASGGELLFWCMHTDAEPGDWPPIRKGMNRLVAWIPPNLLNEGGYRLELLVNLHFQGWFSQPGVNAPSVRVDIRGGLSKSPHWMTARPGLIAPHIRFATLEGEK
jgi:lipopolysaccharide transport system ATP-binding protein